MPNRFHPTVEIAPGAVIADYPSTWSWTDITYPYVHQPSKISITRGRRDRYAQTAPSTCALTLLNPAGIWVPGNPVGPYYGLIDLNTPLRVMMRPTTNQLSDAFNRTASSSWGSADSGGAWTNAGGAASDFSVSAANGGRHLHTSAAVRHTSLLGLSIIRSDQTVKIRVNATSTGAAQTAGIVLRYIDANNYRRAELQFNTTGTITARFIVRLAGVDNITSTEVTGLTHSTSAWVWLRVQTGSLAVRVKAWADGTTEPRTWVLDAADSAATAAVSGLLGLHSIREASNTNANATIDFDSYSMIDGPRVQFTGFIDQWPATWADQSESVSFAQITASGHLRRIGQGKRFKSALYRSYTEERYGSAPPVVAYWPCEDGSGSRQVASAIGGEPMRGAGVSYASDSSIDGSDALMTLSGAAAIAGSVPIYPASSTWAVRFVCKIPSGPGSATILADWRTPGGTIGEWQLWLVPGAPDTFRLVGWSSAGVDLIADAGIDFTDGTTELYDRQLMVEVAATQNGADIDWSYNIWYGTVGTGRVGTELAATLANINQVYIPRDSNLASFTIGHIAIGTDTSFGPGAYGASGFAGESTFDRFVRLCTEENIQFVFGEDPDALFGDTTQMMGPQQTTSLLAQLRDVEATEEGILFDGKQGHLALLPRLMRQNHAVNLVVDHDQGQVNWPFAAVSDDYLLRTDVTVSRPGGSSANRADAAAIQQVGVYTDTVTVNTQYDDDLAHRANWRLKQGSAREIRYPQVPLNFARSPELIADWLDTDIGSRISVTNLPAQLPPDDLDLLLEGYTEVIDTEEWTATLNCSPARPWTVWRIEGGGNLGRLDTAGSVLAGDVTSTATSLLVATEVDPLWSTAGVPYDIGIAGEQITVTAAASGIVDTFTRSASSGWGTTDSGQSWVVGAGTAALFSATGSVGQIAVSALNTEHHIAVNLGYATHQRVRTYLTLGVTPTGAAINWGVMLRRADASNLYWIDVQVGTTSELTIRVISKIAGVNTQLTTAVSATAHSTSVARILVAEIDSDNVIRAKVYAAGATERGWELVYDASAVVGLGAGTSVGCIARLATGNTNVGPVNFQFDNFAVLDPQQFTVTRSVNGVAKAQTSGAVVKLWKPGRLAL